MEFTDRTFYPFNHEGWLQNIILFRCDFAACMLQPNRLLSSSYQKYFCLTGFLPFKNFGIYCSLEDHMIPIECSFNFTPKLNVLKYFYLQGMECLVINPEVDDLYVGKLKCDPKSYFDT